MRLSCFVTASNNKPYYKSAQAIVLFSVLCCSLLQLVFRFYGLILYDGVRHTTLRLPLEPVHC